MKCIYCDQPAKRRPDGFVVCHKCTEQNKVYTELQKRAKTIAAQAATIKEANEYISDMNEINKAQAAKITRLRDALKEIDELLHGELPVTRQAKEIARKALED